MKGNLLKTVIISICIICTGPADANQIEEIVVVGQRPGYQGTLQHLNGLVSHYQRLAAQEASRGRKLVQCTAEQNLKRVECEALVLEYVAKGVSGCAKGRVVREAEIELKADSKVVGGRVTVNLFDSTQYYNECIDKVNAKKEASLKDCEARFNSYACDYRYGA